MLGLGALPGAWRLPNRPICCTNVCFLLLGGLLTPSPVSRARGNRMSYNYVRPRPAALAQQLAKWPGTQWRTQRLPPPPGSRWGESEAGTGRVGWATFSCSLLLPPPPKEEPENGASFSHERDLRQGSSQPHWLEPPQWRRQ